MLLVRDLTKLAWFRGVEAFTRFLGPIAVMQETPVNPARPGMLQETMPIPTLKPEMLAPLGVFGSLAVAMLPEPSPDGTVQLVVGRDPACALVLDHPSVSSNHAAIRWDGKHGIVVDLASANGIFVNRRKIGAQATLNSGDHVSFGMQTCVFLESADLYGRLRRFKPDA